MKKILILSLLVYSITSVAQFYDDFSDGNYTANPRWYTSNMDAQIVVSNNGYAVELHPIGNIADSNLKQGSFRTANTLTDNTWWGCDLTLDVKNNSTGKIKFYISSSLPSLGNGTGFYLDIDLSNKQIQFIYETNEKKTLTTSTKSIPLGTINLTCKIIREGKNWEILCIEKQSGIKILHSTLTSINSTISSATSTGFVIIEEPNNPCNLRINSVNCGDRPSKTEMINSGDIVITEIMAKPNPSVELPEVEWLEIYNPTDRTLTLEGCKISTSAKTGTFTDYILEPNDYAIICSYNAMTELIAITDKICIVESMPTLTNDGNLLILKNRQNHIISFVEYSSDWYNSEPFKADGGWSLERIDPNNPISDSNTWGPSIDPRGGSPAQANSIQRSLPDTIIPRITNIGIENALSLQIHFNKPMQGEIIALKENIEISGNSLSSISWIEPQREILNISLSEPLDSTNAIDISFYNVICVSGWSMPDTTISVALPYQAKYMDLVFNELMTYVSDENSKFIELYNNSNFFIDLNKVMLSNRDSNGNLDNSKIFCQSSTILPPNQFVVISPNTNAINCQLGINPQSIYITATLPSMPASDGIIVLSDRGGNIIDEIQYSDSWHHPLLNDLHDISLERIDPIATTQNADNWHSAAESVGYNTAGWSNSQTINNSNTQTNQQFWLEESTFSPNNDGYDDHLVIHHNLPTQGYTLTIDVYTRSGAHINRIIDNQLLTPQGYTLWDGITPNGSVIPAGLYVLVVQAIDPKGLKITQKLICIKI